MTCPSCRQTQWATLLRPAGIYWNLSRTSSISPGSRPAISRHRSPRSRCPRCSPTLSDSCCQPRSQPESRSTPTRRPQTLFHSCTPTNVDCAKCCSTCSPTRSNTTHPTAESTSPANQPAGPICRSRSVTPALASTPNTCLLYTSDAADEEDSVDLG